MGLQDRPTCWGPPAAQRLLLTPSSSVGDRAQICFPPVSSCLAEFRLGKRIYMVILAPKVLSSSSSIDSLGLNSRVEPCGPPCLRDWSPSLVSKKTSAKEGFLKFPRLWGHHIESSFFYPVVVCSRDSLIWSVDPKVGALRWKSVQRQSCFPDYLVEVPSENTLKLFSDGWRHIILRDFSV